MKATKLFLVSVFALLFFVGNELSAQIDTCADGSPPHTAYINFPDVGDIVVYYCCIFHATHGYPVVEMKGLYLPNPQDWAGVNFAADTFWIKLYQQFVEYLDGTPTPPCGFIGDIPSCDDSTAFQQTYIEINRADCWGIVSVQFLPDTTWHPYVVPCEETFECQKLYKVCYDMENNGDILMELISSESYEGNCWSDSLMIDPDIIFSDGKIPYEITKPCVSTCN